MPIERPRVRGTPAERTFCTRKALGPEPCVRLWLKADTQPLGQLPASTALNYRKTWLAVGCLNYGAKADSLQNRGESDVRLTAERAARSQVMRPFQVGRISHPDLSSLDENRNLRR